MIVYFCHYLLTTPFPHFTSHSSNTVHSPHSEVSSHICTEQSAVSSASPSQFSEMLIVNWFEYYGRLFGKLGGNFSEILPPSHSLFLDIVPPPQDLLHSVHADHIFHCKLKSNISFWKKASAYFVMMWLYLNTSVDPTLLSVFAILFFAKFFFLSHTVPGTSRSTTATWNATLGPFTPFVPNWIVEKENLYREMCQTLSTL